MKTEPPPVKSITDRHWVYTFGWLVFLAAFWYNRSDGSATIIGGSLYFQSLHWRMGKYLITAKILTAACLLLSLTYFLENDPHSSFFLAAAGILGTWLFFWREDLDLVPLPEDDPDYEDSLPQKPKPGTLLYEPGDRRLRPLPKE